MARKASKAGSRSSVISDPQTSERIGTIRPLDGITLTEDTVAAIYDRRESDNDLRRSQTAATIPNWIYRADAHGLALLDGIAAKYPDDYFNMIVADGRLGFSFPEAFHDSEDTWGNPKTVSNSYPVAVFSIP